MHDLPNFIIKEIEKRIAGEIAISNEPGAMIRKWREIFGVTQSEIARAMGVTPGVISDYEKGKRQPGSKFIKKFVQSLINIDKERGWSTLKEFVKHLVDYIDAVVDMADFERPVSIDELISVVDGYVPTSYINPSLKLYGYTVIDSIRSIEELDAREFSTLMGLSMSKAIIFTRVKSGRSPMVAMRVTHWKPNLVVLHEPRMLDTLALRLAEKDKITVVVSLVKDVETLVERLRSLAGYGTVRFK